MDQAGGDGLDSLRDTVESLPACGVVEIDEHVRDVQGGELLSTLTTTLPVVCLQKVNS